jgi:mono/diheme cytochrome c family protein
MNNISARHPVSIWAAAVLIVWLAAVFTAAQGPVAPQTSAPIASTAEAQTHLATIKQYCATCHNERMKTAGVSFEGVTAESLAQHPDVFEKAVRKLRGRVMPPPGARQPEGAAVDSLVAWLEKSLDRAATRAHLPDRIVLHRLNRKEYTNAVRDLLAVDFDATEVLPADDLAEGFDNIADALQVSPSFIEQYVIRRAPWR